MNKSNIGIKFLLTLISIYRVFPTVQKPKLNTITDPFTGISRVLDIGLLRSAKKDLHINRVFPFNHRFINLESASPLATKSLWGSNLDLIGL
jgi:hypothetical protein